MDWIDRPVTVGERIVAMLRALRILAGAAPWPASALLLVTMVESAAPAAVFWSVGRLVSAAGTGRLSDLSLVAGVAGAAIALGSLLPPLEGDLVFVAIERLRFALRVRTLTALARLPGLAHFEDPRVGDRIELAARGTAVSATAQFKAGRGGGNAGRVVFFIWSYSRWLVVTATSGVVALRLQWWAPLLIVAGGIPEAVNAVRHALSRERKARAGAAHERLAQDAYSLALEAPSAREIRLFGFGAWLAGRHERLRDAARGPLHQDLLHELKEGIGIGIPGAIVAAVPLLVAYRSLVAGQLSPGDFTAGVLALGLMGVTIRAALSLPAQFIGASHLLPDVFRVMDLPVSDPRLERRNGIRPRQRSGLRVESVTFAYPGTDLPVLDGLDLDVPAGGSLALVGENGSGKSTLVKLLCRLYDPDAGRILLDGVDLRDRDLDELRRELAIVFQEFLHLPSSLRDNVTLRTGAPAGAALRQASEEAGLDRVLTRLRAGPETPLIGDLQGGAELSGGEWQRVALARLTLARRERPLRLMVFDEPTSALDVRVEQHLAERFRRITDGVTSIVISHRLSTTRLADRIALIEQGRAVEIGDHASLMTRGGRYAELFELQASRFREQRA